MRKTGWRRFTTPTSGPNRRRSTRSPVTIRCETYKNAGRACPSVGAPSKVAGSSTAIAQRVNQQAEGCRSLTATGIVEVITRIRLAPFYKYAVEAALGEVRLGDVFRYVGNAEPVER